MKIIYIDFPQKFKFSCINLFGIFIINKNLELKLSENPFLYTCLLQHEKIHTAQGRELLWLFFYLFYCLEWLIRLVQYRNAKLPNGEKDWYAAYRNISFEREAKVNEENPLYLQHRSLYSFIKYIFSKHSV